MGAATDLIDLIVEWACSQGITELGILVFCLLTEHLNQLVVFSPQHRGPAGEFCALPASLKSHHIAWHSSSWSCNHGLCQPGTRDQSVPWC